MKKNSPVDCTNPEKSEFIVQLTAIRTRREQLCSATRPLTDNEISLLKAQGNSAEGWSTIQVVDGFSPKHITNSQFFGHCHLGSFTGLSIECTDSITLPSGIHNSTVINSVISNDCCIRNARCISNYFIDEGAVIFNTGTIGCKKQCTFGNGTEIPVGMEIGGREIPAFADITIPVAASIAKTPEGKRVYKDFLQFYLELCTTHYGVIGRDAHICNCPSISDTFIGEQVICENCTGIHNASIAGSSDEPSLIRDGALIRDSIVQWGCRINSMAIVERAVCIEHSHVERHAKVTDSIIGPNTGIAEGEVTASLVGPFVGFHHQSLLIGALWPEGRGNVAYGANVGSNHTAKAPDQEIYCGEGVFFGLGVNIKFPADLSHAPYSIIATGVTTLPQRMTFPFSLINTPSEQYEEIPLSFNELVPGWVLSDNLYMVFRNVEKFRNRNKANRSTITPELFRPDIIDLLLDSRNRLRDAAPSKKVYTEGDIPGIGKNFISRNSLSKAIETYSLRIEHYCLTGLYHYLKECMQQGKKVEYHQILDNSDTADTLREHTRTLLVNEGFSSRSLQDNLERLMELTRLDAKAVAQSKGKDDLRGIKIMDDYTSFHGTAADDPFVRQTENACERFIGEVGETLRLLHQQ